MATYYVMPQSINFLFWSIKKITPNQGKYNRVSPDLFTSHLRQGKHKNQTNQSKIKYNEKVYFCQTKIWKSLTFFIFLC